MHSSRRREDALPYNRRSKGVQCDVKHGAQLCKDYGAFLSPGATVTSGNRTFTGRDMEVFKYIALLRAEGMQKGAIMHRLGETTFAEVDTHEQYPATTTQYDVAFNALAQPPQDAPTALSRATGAR